MTDRDDELAALIRQQQQDDDRFPRHWPRFGDNNRHEENAVWSIDAVRYKGSPFFTMADFVGDVRELAGVEWEDPTADAALGIEYERLLLPMPTCTEDGCDRPPRNGTETRCDPCRQRALRRRRDPLVGRRPIGRPKGRKATANAS